MKKLITLTFVLFLSSFAFAQKVTVVESEMEIEKVTRPGLITNLELEKKLVKDDWKKHLKKYGKVEVSGNEFVIKSANIPSVSSNPINFISTIEKGKKGIAVFIAIDLGEKWITKDAANYSAAEKFLHDFGVMCYKNQINNEIKDAEKELKKAEKAEEKSIKEGENLSNKIDKNIKDKSRLENELKQNQEDKVQLEKDIETNKKDQEDQKENVNKSKSHLDKVKSKLDKVF